MLAGLGTDPNRKMVVGKVMADKSLAVPEGLGCHRLQTERVSAHMWTPGRPGSNPVHMLISCTEQGSLAEWTQHYDWGLLPW